MYWHLEDKYGVRREEIPDKVGEFMAMLRKMYGSGAEVIERIIVGEMAREFGVKLRVKSLEKAIRRLKRENAIVRLIENVL